MGGVCRGMQKTAFLFGKNVPPFLCGGVHELALLFKFVVTSLIFLLACLPAHSGGSVVHVGASALWVSVLPKIFWSDPIRRWAVDTRARFNAGGRTFSSNVALPISAWEGPLTTTENRLLNRPPEAVLFNKYRNSWGASVWAGVGHVMPSYIYIGIEQQLVYKHMSIDEKSKDNTLIQISEPVNFCFSSLSGRSTYDLNFHVHERFQTETSIRLGFLPKDFLLVYLKVGVALNIASVEQLCITVHNGLTIEPWQRPVGVNLFEAFPDNIQYSSPGQYRCFAALALGGGVEKTLRGRWFARLEYTFRMAFSSNWRSLVDGKEGEVKPNALEYTLKYQDMEHQIAIGFGRRFGGNGHGA